MSTFLALSAVSAVLRGVLQDSVGRHNLATVLGGTPDVTALPPDRIEVDEGSPDRLNLFLFQATENAAWRNMDLPVRNGRGDRLGNARLALDLNFLVTAYGSAELHAEALLGHALFVFHEVPVITRDEIANQLGALTASPLADALGAARLDRQFEQIRIAPRVMNVEEVSKIWTSLQSPYRPTAAYHVSVVLVEASHPAGDALPVLTRGQPVAATGGDEGVRVQAGCEPTAPILTSLALLNAAPALRMGETLTLRGHHLHGTNHRIRFHPPRSETVLELPASGTPGATAVEVTLPAAPASPTDWRAGIFEVSLVVEQDGEDHESNRLPLFLVPRLDSVDAVPPAGPVATLDITCSPPVQEGQTVSLLVGSRALAPVPFAAPATALSFTAPTSPPLASGSPLPVRLRVDDVESLVVDYGTHPPAFAPSQTLTIP